MSFNDQGLWSNEQGYLDLLQDILENGHDTGDRTGVGTRSVFGRQLRFDLTQWFPLLTTKKVFPRGMFAELAWLISGETNIGPLLEQDVHIWDEWADANGDLGPVYGAQWRDWGVNGDKIPEGWGIDQLQNALDLLITDPNSRRNVVNTWNPSDLDKMALSPCHMSFQFKVYGNQVSCHMYQRSADVFLGVPFNIASYAALTHLMAHLAGLEPGELIISFGDVHIYNNHMEQVQEQLTREIQHPPTLCIDADVKSLDDVKTESFLLADYHPLPAIKGEVAV